MQAVIITTMSVYLVSTLALLFAGAIVTFALARYRPQAARAVAAAFALLALVLWILAGRNLPLVMFISERPLESNLPQMTFQVNQIGWELSFYSLLLVASALMVLAALVEKRLPDSKGFSSVWLVPASLLMLTGTMLVSLWAVSIAALIMSWTLLALAWLVAAWAVIDNRERFEVLFLRFGALLAGGLFLWLATASTPAPMNTTLEDVAWSGASRTWLALAAAVQLGVFPLHWWRPLKRPLPPVSASLLHIVPAVAGAALLARLADAGGDSGGQLLLLTVLGLLGMVVGVSLALSHIQRPGWSTAALTLALVSVIAMIGAWAGSGAILALTRVMILGLGGLFMVAGWRGTRPKTLVAASLIFVAALAGFPLTAGFYALASLYNAWFTDGRFVIVLAVALIFMLLIAAATAIAWPMKPGEDRNRLPSGSQAQYGFALLLLVVGLFALPGYPLSEIQVATWLAILIPAVAGVALSRTISQVHDVQDAMRGAFHLNLPLVRLGSAIERLLSGAAAVFRESAAILEGEGGMLWLLILVVVLWLARRG